MRASARPLLLILLIPLAACATAPEPKAPSRVVVLADWMTGTFASTVQAEKDPDYFDNSAQLIVLRADWKFLEGWESLAELRTLDFSDLDQQRSGALLAIYRYIGKHLKVGAGYNFTDFSEDLTDLSYDHQGAFINIVGTM